MHFWSYDTHKKVTFRKIFKMVRYLFQYIYLILSKRPQYVLYNMSFDKMPFLKDFIFCGIGKVLGCRIVIHDMGQYVRELYDSSSNFYKWLVRKFCEMATASIVLGEGTKGKYEGFMDSSTLVAVPGCVTDFYDKGKREEKKNGCVEVLYFSFLSRTKGVLTAIHAIPKVIQKNANIRFIFGGPFESNELKAEIEEFVESNNLKPYVKFLGYVESDEKRTELMRNADIFIFPTHRDVFGLVLLHAMAESLPIVASIEGTIPEIIEDGKGGILFPKGDETQLADKILTLSHDETLRKKMGGENRERFLKIFTPSAYGHRMIHSFEQIAQFELQ